MRAAIIKHTYDAVMKPHIQASSEIIEKPAFTFIDLFAGIGGFRIALEQAGGKCVFSSEWDKNAQETYFKNFGEIPFGDITKEETKSHIPDNFDILCGGFPCQPFSICGRKKGFEDTRGTLFFDICQILEEKQPKICILENVSHLTKHDGGRTFRIIIESLRNLGYNVAYKVLNAKDFSLAQSRERIFIVGTKQGLFNFEKIKKGESVVLKDMLDQDGDFEFLNKEEYTLLDKTYVKQQDKTGLIFCGYRNKGIWKKGIRPNTEYLSRCHRQPNRIYSIEGTHPTIPSQETSGRFFIYNPKTDKVRKLTINECYRLMGFPDSFIKSNNVGEKYRQIGNSVAIPVVKAIIDSLIEQNFLNQSAENDNVRGYIQQLEFCF